MSDRPIWYVNLTHHPKLFKTLRSKTYLQATLWIMNGELYLVRDNRFLDKEDFETKKSNWYFCRVSGWNDNEFKTAVLLAFEAGEFGPPQVGFWDYNQRADNKTKQCNCSIDQLIMNGCICGGI